MISKSLFLIWNSIEAKSFLDPIQIRPDSEYSQRLENQELRPCAL
jgi:hypothetical protein